MYVYIKSEPNLYTVGFYDPSGKWTPESDHETKDEAGDRVAYLNGSKVVDTTKIIEVLDMIIEDCETDVKDFDGKPFTGKTLGELHGILEAKIQALAKNLKKYLESK